MPICMKLLYGCRINKINGEIVILYEEIYGTNNRVYSNCSMRLCGGIIRLFEAGQAAIQF